MRLGMPSLMETETLEEAAALCRKLGLDFVELNMNLPRYQIQTMDVSAMRETAKKYGISYTVHLDENLNVADFNPLVAAAYRETVRQTVELAKKLEIPVLNMHMPLGVYFTLPQGKVFLFERYRQRFLEEMGSFREECEKAAGCSGIRICVENWVGYTPWQIEALDILLESPVFGLTFDVGHNRCKGGIDEPVILQRGDRLHHMHLHDVSGGKDHLALGTGELDVAQYLDLARDWDCSVVLETKTVAGLTESVRWLREYERRGSA